MAIAGAVSASIEAAEPTPPKLTALPYSAVRIADEFWSPRISLNQKVSIRDAFRKCEESGNIGNFKIAAGLIAGEHKGSQAYDSDVYKIIEGAAYSLKIQPDAELESYVDGLVEAIAAAQQKDGYLNTYFILRFPDKKWEMLPTEHELYCAGHLFEAGVAYFEATGKRKLLDVAVRLADHIDSIFGPGKRYEVPGHQEIELALVKLARCTGEKRYFDLATFFLDERGYAHGNSRRPPTPEEMALQNTVDPNNRRSVWSTRRYRQDQAPVVDQDEAVGHAVRAGYMYAAMADVALQTGDLAYKSALDNLWANVVGQKQYITGGVGTAQFGDEGFGTPYNLPNDRAYCETCAAGANILWNQRMNLLEGDAKYADVLELALYNGFLAGVSLSGVEFSYQNPLSSSGRFRRNEWSDPACCPSNVVRLIPQIGNFIYAQDSEGIYVNLYTGGTAEIPWKGDSVSLTQATRYPWDGKVKITLGQKKAEEFTLNMRIPAWTGASPLRSDLYRFADGLPSSATEAKFFVNGKSVKSSEMMRGYARIRRTWKKGDIIEMDLPMPVRRVEAHPSVEADRGRVALMRGPIVYCVESADNPFDVQSVALTKESTFKPEFRSSFLGGVAALLGKGSAADKISVDITAIPYYAWANRGKGAMAVWIRQAEFR